MNLRTLELGNGESVKSTAAVGNFKLTNVAISDETMRGNFAKLCRAMGFRRSMSNGQNIESISKAKHDKDSGDHTATDPSDLDASDTIYSAWLNEHPSALRCFKGMMSTAKGKKIIVFLDYDGTLSPIVNDPDRAFMSDRMRSAVHEVARRFPTAIISGRSRDKVYEFVQLDEVYYAGSHGLDIRGPPLQLKSYDAKYQTRALDKKMLKEFEKKTSEIQGVVIEDNRFSISVHYRHVQEKDYGILQEAVHSVLAKYPCFHLTKGLKVLEIRPSIKWNKGHALEYLLDTLGFTSSSNFLPVYIGDDQTDEDAFKVLQSKGLGFPIIVSSIPRHTMASHSLHDPSEVLSFLIRLARWGENSSN
ncbi:probable trehalose-phosphate phosphatase D isoform X2 [Diospyros lotus]|uniref:probable trehalose-phosphate phosphatase D isoform X2 n=1 Tax=Diospyros lotus TaxID=55363 RepID=UPI002250BEB1|nr:probable trehalose-phosphate phosphatase D isoform X2 [Diospyros lotus]